MGNNIVISKGYYIINHYAKNSHSMQSYNTFAVNENEAMGKFNIEVKGRELHSIKCIIEPVKVSMEVFLKMY